MTNVMPLPFTGDLIDYLKLHSETLAVLWHDGDAYVAVKPICAVLGIAWQPQHKRLTAPESGATVILKVIVAEDGKQREMLCIHIADLPIWLNSLTPSRVKETAREPLIRLKTEIRLLVFNHFKARLLGEAEASCTLAKRLMNEVLITNRKYQRVVTAYNLGLSFAQFKGSWPSVSVTFAAETVMTCFRLGLIDRLPEGMPAVQQDLFSHA